MIAYSTKVHRYHGRLLDRAGTSLTKLDMGIDCGVQLVSSMSSCDIAASSASEITVDFGAHPALISDVHIWTGRRRWRPQLTKRIRRFHAAASLKDFAFSFNGRESEC